MPQLMELEEVYSLLGIRHSFHSKTFLQNLILLLLHSLPTLPTLILPSPTLMAPPITQAHYPFCKNSLNYHHRSLVLGSCLGILTWSDAQPTRIMAKSTLPSPQLLTIRSTSSMFLKLTFRTGFSLGRISNPTQFLLSSTAPSSTTISTLLSLSPASPPSLDPPPITRLFCYHYPPPSQKLASSALKISGFKIKLFYNLSCRLGSRHRLGPTRLGSWPLASNRQERRQRFGPGVSGHPLTSFTIVSF